ncbi:NADP-dependent isocitrate dehydrogenase [Spiribacter sp. C176]|uniref:Isocitrate dehydrogenase [NADP] n=1 Tax=Spiribacter salilacus TaxID=2664894 RepID=A0A6N7QYA2_9GAMM|nr:NADP-dependent isocitrate dehydrogenase [Spiribacter salilacus]MRH77664.1 NADP-dependent isocitrate dehydrogenase [Spiribacter salilacus]
MLDDTVISKLQAPQHTQPFSQNNHQRVSVGLAQGDGIGPEITQAVVDILKAADAPIDFVPIAMGEQSYLSGATSGIDEQAWAKLRQHRILLKGPITTPQGGGYKSINVTLRKSLGLFANIRPCQSWAPWIKTRHPAMDVLIVRENEEDTYAGIEHRQTQEVTQCLKLISRPGCERLIRYGFELAQAQGRKTVHCLTKDNIMKLTDGLFHKVFDEVAEDYPNIEAKHLIIDIGSALLADQPEQFEVIIAPNLYGDILSDVAAQLTGSVGLGGSANIGQDFAMFEAVHGSAPDIAGCDVANPSGMLFAALQMLRYTGAADVAERIQTAWQATMAAGLHTADIFSTEQSNQKLGTQAFAQAVIERLPEATTNTNIKSDWPDPKALKTKTPKVAEKKLVGVDVFIEYDQEDRNPQVLGKRIEAISAASELKLSLITNRGVKVYPHGLQETTCTDHWRCRFKAADNQPLRHSQILSLLAAFDAAKLDFIKTEHLYTFNGEPGFSMGQGE